ncbi:MAG: sigma-70 family RNA polymerase sigma factor [Planctomycetota bacterium]
MNATPTCPWSDLDHLRPQLVSFLRTRLRDDNDVEDVVQECFLRAARHRAQEGEPEKLHAWLYSVAESARRDHLRRRHRRPALHVEAEVFDQFEGRESTPGEDADEDHLHVERRSLERRRLFACLARALRRLEPEDQRVLDAFYGGSGRCVDVARVEALDPAHVKARLFRARRKLSRIVRRELPVLQESGPSAAAVAEAVRATSGAGRRFHDRGAQCLPVASRVRSGAQRAGMG